MAQKIAPEVETFARIKVVGVGGSGTNAVTHMIRAGVKGVEFIAVTQNIDTTTSTGKLQMQIMGAFAEFERNIISERTKEGMIGAKNVGKRGKDKKERKKRGVLRK